MKLDKQKKINAIMFGAFVLVCIIAIIIIPKNKAAQKETIKQEINQANQLIEKGEAMIASGKQLKMKGQKMKKQSIHKVYKWAYGSGFLNTNK